MLHVHIVPSPLPETFVTFRLVLDLDKTMLMHLVRTVPSSQPETFVLFGLVLIKTMVLILLMLLVQIVPGPMPETLPW